MKKPGLPGFFVLVIGVYWVMPFLLNSTAIKLND
jgi:hypothetical protein